MTRADRNNSRGISLPAFTLYCTSDCAEFRLALGESVQLDSSWFEFRDPSGQHDCTAVSQLGEA